MDIDIPVCENCGSEMRQYGVTDRSFSGWQCDACGYTLEEV